MEISEATIIKRNEVDLTEILSVLWRNKLLIIALSTVFAVGSVFFALSLPNVYQATTVLTPAEDDQGGMLSGLKSEFGGLAAMAGVNLGGGKSNKSQLALQVLKSRAFISEFVDKYDLKAKLMATEGWDLATDKLIYKDKMYNAQTGEWLRDVVPPMTAEPSVQEVFDFVMGNNVQIEEEQKKGIVTLSVTHYSPKLAKFIADHLVLEINLYMKKHDVAEAEGKIAYLTKTLEETAVADMQRIFYQLIEQQEQTKMLAKTQKQYVFKTIDPAIEPDRKAGPKRALICAGITFLGFAFAAAIALFRHFVLLKPIRK